jgi:hypothetical protein
LDELESVTVQEFGPQPFAELKQWLTQVCAAYHAGENIDIKANRERANAILAKAWDSRRHHVRPIESKAAAEGFRGAQDAEGRTAEELLREATQVDLAFQNAFKHLMIHMPKTVKLAHVAQIPSRDDIQRALQQGKSLWGLNQATLSCQRVQDLPEALHLIGQRFEIVALANDILRTWNTHPAFAFT